MNDYHAIQLTGTPCANRNCAAASGAMAVYMGSGGKVHLTADQFRHESGASCVPGVHSPSGGLYIEDVVRVAASHGVMIDYGTSSIDFYRRWTNSEASARLSRYYGAIFLGEYSAVQSPWRAHGSTFQGGHSLFAHDDRVDLPDSHFDKVQPTVCWHDPLRPRPIRVPFYVLGQYMQHDSPYQGFAGFVRIPVAPGAHLSSPLPDRTRTAYATVAVHSSRTTGTASTIRVIRGKGTLVCTYQHASGAAYKGSTDWLALSMLGNEWVHSRRLSHVGGST